MAQSVIEEAIPDRIRKWDNNYIYMKIKIIVIHFFKQLLGSIELDY